jgi:hypothetical protein
MSLARLSLPELFRHRQRAQLVGLQGDLLGQYDVTRYKTVFGHKTPSLCVPRTLSELMT